MFNTKEYWENRYKSGENSGEGSYNKLAEFKAKIVNDFIIEHDILSMIDWGCGDGNQIEYFDRIIYTGIDISDFIIKKCRKRFSSDRLKVFFNYPYVDYQIHDLAISLDVIFHLITDSEYYEYLNFLFSSTEKYVIIYTMPIDGIIDPNDYIKIRDTEGDIRFLFPEWSLEKKIENIYPEETKCNFYFYEKIL